MAHFQHFKDFQHFKSNFDEVSKNLIFYCTYLQIFPSISKYICILRRWNNVLHVQHCVVTRKKKEMWTGIVLPSFRWIYWPMARAISASSWVFMLLLLMQCSAHTRVQCLVLFLTTTAQYFWRFLKPTSLSLRVHLYIYIYI